MLNFPINEVIPSIKKELKSNTKLIIEAPAGAGKSTIVPISLLNESWLGDKIIIVLEPRRVAARAVATQMAKLLGEELGKTVGYQVKMESKFSKDTKILVVTEGILVRKLQSDQELEDVACVIFDEFHERSIHTDLSLALSLQCQEMLREDLKIVLMSATLNSNKLISLLGDVSLVKSDGRMFDVEAIYLQDSIKHPNTDNITELLSDITFKSIKEDEGDILVFLAGVKEINSLKTLLDKKVNDEILILPLHSNLSKNEQDLAINKNVKRKIILSTNLAQTSLTIEGVKVVIDSGLEKLSRFDYANGMDHLELSFISEDSSIQREGRAGRLSEGKCYKLWHKKRLLEKEIKPEILRVDLSSFLLDTILWGVESLDELVLLDIPNKEVINSTLKLLHRLEMLDNKNAITSFGQDSISLGLHPRLSYMLLKANELGLEKEASIIASLLVEKDVFNNSYNSKDFLDRFDAVNENKINSSFVNIHRVKQVKKQAQFYLKRLEKIKEIKQTNSFDKKLISVLLLFAYPDRLGKLRANSENKYALSNKKQALLLGNDTLFKCEYLVISSLSAKQTDSYINQACKIDMESIKKYFSSHIKSEIFINDESKFEIKELSLFEDLVLSSKPAHNLNQEDYEKAILNYIKSVGVQKVFDFDKKTTDLLNRVKFLNQAQRDGFSCDLELPDLSFEYLTTSVDTWLASYIIGFKKIQELKKLDLYSILSSLISWEDSQKLDILLPSSLKVPSGSNIKIDYSSGQNPILEVKIQEVFGLMETPKVLNNQIALTIHLLTPAQRPIQITQDLKSFWDNSYDEVRKELRGKYKKHYWPENPYEAIATSKTKKRM